MYISENIVTMITANNEHVSITLPNIAFGRADPFLLLKMTIVKILRYEQLIQL